MMCSGLDQGGLLGMIFSQPALELSSSQPRWLRHGNAKVRA